MSLAIVFPGQGSQKVGMGETLFDTYPELTTNASTILGYDIKKLCLEDPDGNLSFTQYTQPALYVVSALLFKALKKSENPTINWLAGHSLGEYNACEAAKVFSFEEGLKLVKKRGELMGTISGGGMAAVLGLSVEEIKDVLKDHQLETIDVANLNTPVQTVLSGLKTDIELATPIFEEKAKRFIPLNVSGAFHSRYMVEAQKEFEKTLDHCTFSAPKIPIVSNVTAQPYQNDAKALLAAQISSPVQWVNTIRFMKENNVETFKEVGPGKVLTGLIRKI